MAKSASEANKTFKDLDLTEELVKPSVDNEETMETQEVVEWMKPIIQYLEHGILPDDKLKARKLKIRSAHYSMHN